MDKFEIGDVVQLKSGGPKMTIIEITPDKSRLLCTWFAGGNNKQASFLSAIIVKVETGGTKES